MKTTSLKLLTLALLASAAAAPLVAGECATKSAPAACCMQAAQCAELKTLEQAALKQPSDAGRLISQLVVGHPERLDACTVAVVGAFAQQLPAKELGAALHDVMQASTSLLVKSLTAEPLSPNASAEERRQFEMEHNIRVAAAVQELTRKAADAVKARLTAPATKLAPEADGTFPGGEIMLDPQDYAALMKGSMEQVVRGSLDGIGARVAQIPASDLPSLASVQPEAGSYSYAMVETPMGGALPTAIAAPVEQTEAKSTK